VGNLTKRTGGAGNAAIDIYYNIDPKKLRKTYLASMPQFWLLQK
jgi:hypothetical protein